MKTESDKNLQQRESQKQINRKRSMGKEETLRERKRKIFSKKEKL